MQPDEKYCNHMALNINQPIQKYKWVEIEAKKTCKGKKTSNINEYKSLDNSIERKYLVKKY